MYCQTYALIELLKSYRVVFINENLLLIQFKTSQDVECNKHQDTVCADCELQTHTCV